MEYKSCNLAKQLEEGAYKFRFTSVTDIKRKIRACRERATEDIRERAMENLPDSSLCVYLVFQRVPENAFVQFIKFETHMYRILYLNDSQLLRIKMPGRGHDAAGRRFEHILGMKLENMRIMSDVATDGSGRMEMQDLRKEGDGCWGPIEEDYVTCVLEIGASESARQLTLDAHLWLQSRGSYVTQVVTMNVNTKKPHITVQLWESETRQLRTERANRPRQVLKTQEVQISLVNDVPTASGSFRLSLEKILERPLKQGTNERDIEFNNTELTEIARAAWRRQNFIPREMARAI